MRRTTITELLLKQTNYAQRLCEDTWNSLALAFKNRLDRGTATQKL